MKSLKELRDARMETQEQVARSLHCTTKTYGRVEKGHHVPQNRLLRRLASLFGVDPIELRDHLRDQMAKKVA